MSVPYEDLWWWKAANKPDEVHCDRNGCTRKATQQVAWPYMNTRNDHNTKTEWRHIACDVHADWWSRSSGARLTAWMPA